MVTLPDLVQTPSSWLDGSSGAELDADGLTVDASSLPPPWQAVRPSEPTNTNPRQDPINRPRRTSTRAA